MARKDSEVLEELRDRYDYAKSAWQEIRAEAEKDMQFVSGNPWDADDKKHRKDRPTIAPEEMGQYFNQVINPLRSNPRGMKFNPKGNGASKEGAQFYQEKARETEYRSHAKIAYITAAENAIQRSYGVIKIDTEWERPDSANQEIVIKAVPDPDSVLVDPDAMRPDSSDMRYAFELNWTSQSEHVRTRKPAQVNFGGLSSAHPSWIQGTKILEAKYYTIETTSEKLLLVQPRPSLMARAGQALGVIQAPPMAQVLASAVPAGAKVVKELRTVEVPRVHWYLTNGLEILDDGDWAGKYIPFVTCYGKILYVPDGGEIKRQILSMTRFGRDPWKAYCYACSQELEILGQVPKASVVAAEGQLEGHTDEWEDSYYNPKPFLLYKAVTNATGEQTLPPPQRLAYTQGENLQAIEIVKEGFRRAIQSAMASNFLPTDAQKRNQKSGVALDKIDQAYATGTFHFVDHYDDMIRQTAVIFEDLCDKIYDYSGETGVVDETGTAKTVAINSPQDPKAFSTKGSYTVTVSTGPSADSEQTAVADFTDLLIGKIDMIAQVAGPKAAAAILATGVRMRNIGPEGDRLADIIEPPEYKTQDGEPPDPKLLGMQQQLQQAQGQLQQMHQALESKQVEQAGKFKTEAMKADKDAQLELELKRMDIAGKILIARITASKQSADAAAERDEERLALAVEVHHDELQAQKTREHDAATLALEHLHAHVEGAKDRLHEAGMEHLKHAHALDVIAAQPEPPPTAGGANA